jgi:eukaryotic-like serine/threonine-protein kinase
MPLSTGTKLGPYEIVSPLGAGGMGEVYRARDTRLDRTVAIKILAGNLSSDTTRKLRFEREAKTVSALNHPNICSLFDIGSQDGIDFIVMECIEGESLAQRLERGPLPTDQVLRIGAEIAGAIGIAHRTGVVHRDIKPGNIMLTKSGAKLLDFGLARPTSAAANLASMTATSAEPVSPVTQEGTIVGTFQYMSPEQVEGKEVDARSDIFSLGAVLYEMLTGQRAFAGKSQLSVASAILEKDPAPIRSLQPLTPPSLDHVIQRCLAKDPDDRWQTGRDLAGELKWIASGASVSGDSSSSVSSAVSSHWKGSGIVGWIVAGVLGALLLAGALWWHRSRAVTEAMYFSAPLPFSAHGVAISPDGHTIAVVGFKADERKNLIWLYQAGSRDAKPIEGTENANFPFWSPDGKSLGFFADGKLKRVDVAGGPAQTLADSPNGRGGSWSSDGTIIFTPSGEMNIGINRISAGGGAATPMTHVDPALHETSERWPVFLPDGKHYIFMGFNIAATSAEQNIYLGEIDSNQRTLLVKAQSNAAYAEPGYLLFYRDGILFAQRFDLRSYKLTGEPQAVLTQIQTLPRLGFAVFALSNDGLLVAQNGTSASLSRLLWYDRKGNEVGAVGAPGTYSNVSLSPDGKSAASDNTDLESQNTDIWIYNVNREGARRMTFDPAIDAAPIWRPDGKGIVFASGRKPAFDLYVKNIDGAEDEKLIQPDQTRDRYPVAWSPDGQNILLVQGAEMSYLHVADSTARAFLKTSGTVRSGQFSPDGKWVAYASNESGRWEIYVTSFPGAVGKWQVSNGGGTQPRWRGDGKEIFYLSPDSKMMAVATTEGVSFTSGSPVALFQADPHELVATSEMSAYDVSKDGQRFLINTDLKTDAAQPMSVVLHWDAALKPQ